VPVLLEMILELAVYQDKTAVVKMTAVQLDGFLFGARPLAEALVVEIDAVPQGMAIWFESFNTWTGKGALYLEELFVRAPCRGRGAGKAVFSYLAKLAVARDYSRMEWQVLAKNAQAIAFYEGLGAAAQSEWIKYRLSGDTLAAAAA
jgi:GNAT superfamily N-acetyltransferase